MSQAAVDSLAYLATPPTVLNQGAADVYEGQLFAYAAAAYVVVLDVSQMHVSSVMKVEGSSVPVTALSWYPPGFLCRSQHLVNLRLAAGDGEGQLVVWDVAACQPFWQSADMSPRGRRGSVFATKGPINSVAWVGAGPNFLLASLHAGGCLTLWDTNGGSVLWNGELSAGDLGTSARCLTVDTVDRHKLLAWGARGHLILLTLQERARDRVLQQHYRVEVGTQPGPVPASPEEGALNQRVTLDATSLGMHAAFSGTQDLLLLVLSKEILLFDTEFASLAGATSLPPGMAPFSRLLGSFPAPYPVRCRSLLHMGLERLYVLHRDSSVSVWQRQHPALKFRLEQSVQLLPHSTRLTSTSSMSLVTVMACLSQQLVAAASPAQCSKRPPDSLWSAPSLSALHNTSGVIVDAVASLLSLDDVNDSPTGPSEQQNQSAPVLQQMASVLFLAASADGTLWKWHAPFRAIPPGNVIETQQQPDSTVSIVPQPDLVSMLHMLPGSVTHLAVCPQPVSVTIPAEGASTSGKLATVQLIAVATTSNSVELVTMRRGANQVFQLMCSVQLCSHKDSIKGMRWLGPMPRLLSFCSEKAQNGYRNSLFLTDVRSRVSISLRESGLDSAPLIAIRISPLGRHVLLLFKGAPSEVWAVFPARRPCRVRLLDLPFAAVDWLSPMLPPGGVVDGVRPSLSWQQSTSPLITPGVSEATETGPDGGLTLAEELADFPEERLAFALGDGRGGVLAVRGKRITDTKPKRPTWGFLSGPECIATAITGWGPYVFLGDAEGTLMRWDISSGKLTAVLAAGQGPVKRLYCAPLPIHSLAATPSAGGPASAMRLAALFSSGAWGVWEVDSQGELKPAAASLQACRRHGRVVDLEWVHMPAPVGNGVLLALALEEGGLTIVDTWMSPLGNGEARHRALNIATRVGGAWPFHQGCVAPPPTLGTALLLPHCWLLLLRLLIQYGVPVQLLEHIAAAGNKGVAADDHLEDEIWDCLPSACRLAWQQAPHRLRGRLLNKSSSASQPEVRRMLDSLLDDWHDQGSPLPVHRGYKGAFDGPAAIEGVSWSSTPERPATPVVQAGTHEVAEPSELPDAGVAHADLSEGVVGAGLLDVGGARGAALFHTLGALVAAAAAARADGQLFTPTELSAYQAALASGHITDRMAVAAAIVGEHEEAAFWQRLHSTLVNLEHAAPTQQPAKLPSVRHMSHSSSKSANSAPSLRHASAADMDQIQCDGEAGNDNAALLWSPDVEVKHCQERVQWHEALRLPQDTPALQELRIFEYVALGDFQTAVGHLLASAPEPSMRYYRDALLTLALAAAASASDADGNFSATGGNAGLRVQAAKVITANASSFGDSSLGVPLLCSIGHYSEAVTVLQELERWRASVALTGRLLHGMDRCHALERWAWHLLHTEGRLWQAVGVCVSCGSLSSALSMLREAGPPDAPRALLQACREAGFAFSTVQPIPAGAQNHRTIAEDDARETEMVFSTYQQELMTLL